METAVWNNQTESQVHPSQTWDTQITTDCKGLTRRFLIKTFLQQGFNRSKRKSKDHWARLHSTTNRD